MDEDLSTAAKLEKLDFHLDLAAYDEQQVNVVCKLLASVKPSEIDDKYDFLRMLRSYFISGVPDMAIVVQLAVSGFFNIADDQSQTLLHWIMHDLLLRFLRSTEHITAIIRHGGNPSLTDVNGDTPLHLALTSNLHVDVVTAVLEGQTRPSPLLSTRNKKGWTPMRILASHNESVDVDTLRVLKDFGGDVNEKDESGNSLLHIVFSVRPRSSSDKTNFGDIAKIFVELGADVNAKNFANHVPLRLAIDLGTALNYVIPLIPSLDIINDDSCWDGPFVDYLFKKSQGKPGYSNHVFLDAVFENIRDIHVSDKTLSLAMSCYKVGLKHVKLLLAKGCRVNLEVLGEAIENCRHGFIEALLVKADGELVEMVKVHYPNILVRISGDLDDNFELSWLRSLITLLLDKFEIDVNYKEKEWTLLHNLVNLTEDHYDDTKADMASFEWVVNIESLNINKTIIDEGGIEMTALDFALNINNFKAAEVLIKNFADTTKLGPFVVTYQKKFALTFQLLSVLGHKFDFEKLREGADERSNQELDYVENWISERSKKVLPLKELSALEYRRHATKQEVNQLIEDIEIPDDIQGILFLKCYKSDFVAESESSDGSLAYDDMHDNPFDDEDDFGFQNGDEDDIDFG